MENCYKSLFDLNRTAARTYLEKFRYPWQALFGLKPYLLRLGGALCRDEYDEVFSGVWVHRSVKIAQSANFKAPCIVGENSEIRQGAYIRGGVLVGKNCVVGNSTELKNCILFDGVQVPHFNYVGDSILGFGAHLGAGAITSNVRCDKSPVKVNGLNTGLKKLGAIVGDGVEVGCNSVLNPGTVIGRNTIIYPLSCVRGVISENSIFKNGETFKRE